MKRNYLFMCLMGIALFISCSKDNVEEDIFRNEIIIVDNDDGTNNDDFQEGEIHQNDLIAGQNYIAGTVYIDLLADDTVSVTYDTTNGDWVIVETHLYIGTYDDMPLNNPGNPILGQFPYAENHPPGTTSFTYVGPDINSVLDGDGCFVVAAHAVVVNTVTGQEETAWLFGLDYPGQNWAMYAEMCN